MTNAISASINLGFRKTVETMLKLDGVDVNARDDEGRTLLGACVLSAAQSRSKNEARDQLEIGRLLVARGARADALARAPELANDEHYVAAKRLVEGVVATGSYKKYVRTPLQELLNLLSLAQRGKLATTDPVMKLLVGVDNHVVWNVFTYWKES